MDLKLWLCKNKIKSKDFAHIIGYNRIYISLVCNHRRRPSYEFAKLIEKETGGEVSAMDILEHEYDNVENKVAVNS